MKNMFKTLGLTAALVMVTTVGRAQNFQHISFFSGNLLSLILTNGGGQNGSYTNILSPTHLGFAAKAGGVPPAGTSFPVSGYGGVQGTNGLNLMWTNSTGTLVICTNGSPTNIVSTNGNVSLVTNDTTILTVDAMSWVDKNGQLLLSSPGNSPRSISITAVCGASLATVTDFVFVGVPNGTDEVYNTSGATFDAQFQPTTGKLSTQVFGFPEATFQGCDKIRLRSATIAGAAVAGGNTLTVYKIQLNGFVP